MPHEISRGKGISITGVFPTVDTAGAYAAGDLIGGKLTFDAIGYGDEWGGLIQSLCIADRAKQDANLDIVIFGQDPTGTTFTDQAAFDVADADLLKIIAVVPLTSYKDFADNSFAGVSGLAVPFLADESNQIYVAVVSRGAPTYVAANDLFLTIGTVRE